MFVENKGMLILVVQKPLLPPSMKSCWLEAAHAHAVALVIQVCVEAVQAHLPIP